MGLPETFSHLDTKLECGGLTEGDGQTIKIEYTALVYNASRCNS